MMEARYCVICNRRYQPERRKQMTCGRECGYTLIKRRTAKRLTICKFCKKKFRAWRPSQKFCSLRCGVRGRTGPTRRKSVDQHNCRCSACGKGVHVQASRNPKATHYCSRKCKDAAQSRTLIGKRNPNFKNAGRKRCLCCKNSFKSYSATQKFCSQKCAHRAAPSLCAGNGFRGTEIEKLCAAALKAKGLLSFRSAGSKGPFDVIAISSNQIRLIQVKRTSQRSRLFQKKDISKLAAIHLPTTLEVVKELWSFLDGFGFYTKKVGNA